MRRCSTTTMCATFVGTAVRLWASCACESAVQVDASRVPCPARHLSAAHAGRLLPIRNNRHNFASLPRRTQLPQLTCIAFQVSFDQDVANDRIHLRVAEYGPSSSSEAARHLSHRFSRRGCRQLAGRSLIGGFQHSLLGAYLAAIFAPSTSFHRISGSVMVCRRAQGAAGCRRDAPSLSRFLPSDQPVQGRRRVS